MIEEFYCILWRFRSACDPSNLSKTFAFDLEETRIQNILAIIRLRLISPLTFSSLSFRSGLSSLWIWSEPFFQIGVSVKKNQNSMANCVDPNETTLMSRLIRIYTICKTIVLVCRAERVKSSLARWMFNKCQTKDFQAIVCFVGIFCSTHFIFFSTGSIHAASVSFIWIPKYTKSFAMLY